MIDALKMHGPFKGLWIGLKRIGRCHPWGGWGYDPVPTTKSKKKEENTSHDTHKKM